MLALPVDTAVYADADTRLTCAGKCASRDVSSSAFAPACSLLDPQCEQLLHLGGQQTLALHQKSPRKRPVGNVVKLLEDAWPFKL